MKFSFLVLKLTYLWCEISAQIHPQTPCPGIFSYEGTAPEQDRWYGVILVFTDEALSGIRLDIRFDRKAQLLVSWTGEVTSSDNERYTILNLQQKLLPGPPLSSRFMVKYDPARGSPQLKSIRLNGRQICPPDPNFVVKHPSRPHEVFIETSTRRPDPAFGPEYIMGSLSPSESLDPVVFDHQTSSTTKRYTENTNQYNKPSRNPAKPSYSYNEPDVSNIRTTRRPAYEDNNSNNNGYSNVAVNNNNNNNYYGTTNYYKPQVVTTTESYNYNNQERPNNYYDDRTTTKKPVNYNNQQSFGNENNYYPSHGSNTKDEGGYYNSTSNGNKNNKNPSKPTQYQPSSGGSSSGSKNTYSNQRTSSTTTTTTEKNNQRRTTSKPQSFSNTDSSGSRVHPINHSGGPVMHPPSRPSTTSKYNQNSDENLETSSSDRYECGLVHGSSTSVESAAPVPLITNGQETSRGQWPWHIALYKIQGIGLGLNYICGGTLITLSAVITAAHCVTKELLDRPIAAESLVVYLGKYHLKQFSDDGGVQNKEVKDVHIYPGYNSTNFLGDIAVLILSSPVEYTHFVRPCCLWRFNNTSVVGKDGTVVGWGYDENDRVTEELKMAKMPIVSRETCINSYPEFFSRYTSNRTFCAGFRKGTTVCNGDSGGGFVIKRDSKWYLKGLVSITVAREGQRVCDTNHFVVFTDVSEYRQWLSQFGI